MRPEDQERILTELTSRITDRCAERGRPDEVLADSIYFEKRRLKEDRKARRNKEDFEFWREVHRGMRGASERAQLSLIRRSARRYGEEIAGNFDERVYKAVTRAGVPAFGLLLNAVSPTRLLTKMPDLPTLDDALIVQGETEQLRRLHELGTVILVPTHVSNLDSIIVGYALYRMGLPPFIYGAGLNLFENPMLGFFMHNLGAYTVDRKKKDPLYKEILKEYATLTLEHGYDNIFFPGGTRARSGATEQKLKLGLLGTGVRAFANNLRKGRNDPRVYIVPATLSFQLVLEAETLIDDFLKEQGKSRYIITDDEFARPKRWFDFVRQLMSMDSKIYFTVGRAFDPFGNDVDDDGQSLDPRGRVVEPERYLLRDGEVVHDDKRDAEYTREVGHRVAEAFMKDALIQATNVTARAIFAILRQSNPETDIVRLLRAGGEKEDMTLGEAYAEVSHILDELRGLERRGGIRLGPVVATGTAEDVVHDGLRHFAIYHSQPAAERKGDRIFATDRALLFYYQNRLEGYRLERDEHLAPALTADHRSINLKGMAR
jgi:glycerol-3-phosphate O-acyltransferase